mmetsp:Transcript_68178/g.197446  ORF Transcript_68178/g.197446 Transcript_68178/m.197446 type:complete len:217 (+) Transcript_68178:1038-1688(+)
MIIVGATTPVGMDIDKDMNVVNHLTKKQQNKVPPMPRGWTTHSSLLMIISFANNFDMSTGWSLPWSKGKVAAQMLVMTVIIEQINKSRHWKLYMARKGLANVAHMPFFSSPPSRGSCAEPFPAGGAAAGAFARKRKPLKAFVHLSCILIQWPPRKPQTIPNPMSKHIRRQGYLEVEPSPGSTSVLMSGSKLVAPANHVRRISYTKDPEMPARKQPQ